MHVNGLANKFAEEDESVLASARACLAPLFDDAPMRAMPVFSSGQTVRQAAGTYRGLGSVDLIHAAGRRHHGASRWSGSRGWAALRAAWEAAIADTPLAEAAETDPALRAAMEIGV